MAFLKLTSFIHFRFPPLLLAAGVALLALTAHAAPVSYTHLDVYKRQGVRRDRLDSACVGTESFESVTR